MFVECSERKAGKHSKDGSPRSCATAGAAGHQHGSAQGRRREKACLRRVSKPSLRLGEYVHAYVRVRARSKHGRGGGSVLSDSLRSSLDHLTTVSFYFLLLAPAENTRRMTKKNNKKSAWRMDLFVGVCSLFLDNARARNVSQSLERFTLGPHRTLGGTHPGVSLFGSSLLRLIADLYTC